MLGDRSTCYAPCTLQYSLSNWWVCLNLKFPWALCPEEQISLCLYQPSNHVHDAYSYRLASEGFVLLVRRTWRSSTLTILTSVMVCRHGMRPWKLRCEVWKRCSILTRSDLSIYMWLLFSAWEEAGGARVVSGAESWIVCKYDISKYI